MSRDTSKSVKWIEGIRGIASFTVICTHLSRAFDFSLFLPRNDPDTPARFVQYPFIRILWQGRVGVTIFALLTGYVCALKPLKLARNGQHSEALTAISRSAFRRPPRLVLPQIVAMSIAWTVAQFGGFTTASRSDSDWFRYASPDMAPTFGGEVENLFRNFIDVWTNGHMEYDDHQWALLPFFKGAMIIFVLCAGLIYARFKFRMTIYILYFGYWWLNTLPETEMFGQQLVFGMLLVDLAYHPPYQRLLATRPRLTTMVAIPLIIIGLYIMSYPDREIEWSPWSNELHSLGMRIFPGEEGNDPKRYTALGVDLVAFGIQMCHPAKALLSNRFFMWLGRHSFAVYLIHGTLLRTVLAWMLYGITGQPFTPQHTNEAGEEVGPFWIPRRVHGIPFFLIMFIWIGIVYFCATLWTTHVDSACGKITRMLEERFFVREGQKEDDLYDEKQMVSSSTGPLLGAPRASADDHSNVSSPIIRTPGVSISNMV